MINSIRNNQNRYLNPLLLGAGIAAGGAALGALGGKLLAGQQAGALAQSNKLQALAGLAQAANRPPEIGNIEYQRYATPEEYQLLYNFNPEALSDTELSNILRNQEMRQAQLDVLRQYQELGTEGLSAIDRAALSEIQNEIAMRERGQREAILQNMAARGLSGSGQELAASLAASQQATQDASVQGMRQAAMAQANRQAALERIANLSGGIEQTDFEREAMRARAQDVINQFNTQNRNVAAEQREGLKQRLGEMTTSERNRLAQANVDLENQQRQQNIINKPLAQYGLQSQYVGGIANALGGMAQTQSQQAMNQYNTQAQLLGTGLQAGGTLGAAAYKEKPGSTSSATTNKTS